ncbi:hypothetical protein [Infirmifilum uzonense]|uniref:hypothetical protein n=1 Tax=Infirmifilum uzonense TaxID=1550241 RepID=UPI003C760FE6
MVATWGLPSSSPPQHPAPVVHAHGLAVDGYALPVLHRDLVDSELALLLAPRQRSRSTSSQNRFHRSMQNLITLAAKPGCGVNTGEHPEQR